MYKYYGTDNTHLYTGASLEFQHVITIATARRNKHVGSVIIMLKEAFTGYN
jgi:hypothetical protein